MWAGLAIIKNYACFYPSDIGYAYGFLLSKEMEEAYNSLLYKLVGDKWYDKVSTISNQNIEIVDLLIVPHSHLSHTALS